MASDELNGFVISHKPISANSLKRLLLIFDHLYFLYPEENRYLIPRNKAKIKTPKFEFNPAEYGVLYNGLNFEQEEDSLFDSFEYAENKGLIHFLDLDARKFYEKLWLPLRLSYEFDTSNAELLNTITPIISKGSGFSLENGLIRGGFIQPSGMKLYPDIPPHVSFFSLEQNKLFDGDHQLWTIAGKVNRGLAVCSEYGLVPIIINENVANYYSQKSELARNCEESEVHKSFRGRFRTQLSAVQYLLYKVSELLLPDEIIENIPVRDLVIARNNSIDKCYKLRRELIREIKILSNENFDENTLQEINSYLKSKVVPLARDYNIAMSSHIAFFLKKSITIGITAGTTLLGFNQLLNPISIAFLTGISTVVGDQVSNLVDYAIRRRIDQARNTFSYFINLRE